MDKRIKVKIFLFIIFHQFLKANKSKVIFDVTSKRPSFIIIQQIMRHTRWIVLSLFPKELYKLGFLEGIVRSGKKIHQITRMIY
jgi:hypothetical protein